MEVNVIMVAGNKKTKSVLDRGGSKLRVGCMLLRHAYLFLNH